MAAQEACTIHDLEPETALAVELALADGSPVDVAVVRDSDGGWHAVSDVCSHGKVSLSDGEVEGCAIECWLHGSAFDLVTGAPLSPPATQPIAVYPVVIDGERVLVDVDGAA